MTTITKKLEINAPQEKVWEVISNLGAVQDYNPTVKKSYYNTEIKSEIGAGRICEFSPMGKVIEKAVEWNHGKSYKLQIKPIEKLPFFKEGEALFTLNSISPDKTTVEVIFDYKNSGGLLGKAMNSLMLKNNFNQGFEGILKGLKKHIEEGETILSSKSLKGYKVNFV